MMKQNFKWSTMLCLLFVCSSFLVSMHAQIRVTGVITDTNNEPLIGAAIHEKGTSNGTMTDIEGKYTLNVSNRNATLTFSYVGFNSKEIALNGRTAVNVQLESSQSSLDEIIVVGYGTQKKSSLTAAVSQIEGKELMVTPSTNITSIIGGRIPGVTSVQESGEPGYDQAALRIRGSLRGALYIVDGIPRDINDINPNDIATLSVLKDASAAAVYGLDASGGAVIITTKSGEKGKSKLTYDGSFGISRNANYPEFLDGPSYAYYYNKGLEMDGRDPIFTEEHIKKMIAGEDGWGNTNWMDEVFDTGRNQKHNLSLSGGSDKSKYFASLAYMDQQGNVDKFSYKRYNIRLNLDTEISQGLKVNIGMSGIRGDRKSPAFSAGGGEGSGYEEAAEWMSITRQAAQMHPYLPIYAENGMYTASPNDLQQASSPLAAIENSGLHKQNSMLIQTNLTLTWEVPWIKGLTAKISGYYDYSNATSKQLNTPYTVMLASAPDSSRPGLSYSEKIDPRAKTTITLLEGHNRTNKLTAQTSLGYVTQINKTHNIDVLGVMEIQDMKNNSFSAHVQDIDFPELPELSNGIPLETGNPIVGTSRVARSVGFVYRMRYDYNNRYLAEVSGRYDGSHKFAGNVSGKRWGFFPAASLGWRMSEEGFIKDNFNFIDNLKLRAAIGLLGNTYGVNNETFAFLSTYRYNNKVIIGNGQVNTLYPSLTENPNLTWEKTRTHNIGFDLTMWRDLLTLEFDVFYNYTYDIIGQNGADMPPSMGSHYPTYINRNRADAKGIDVMIGHRNDFKLAGRTFNYGAKMNITWAKNRWLRYNDSPNVPNYQKLTGKPVGAQSIFIADGLFQTEEEIDNAAWRGSKRPRLGDIKYRDLNGDNIIDEKDRGYFGKSNRPEFTTGLTLYGNWNGFDFNVLFTGALKSEVSMASTYYNGNDDTTILSRLFKSNSNSPRYLAEGAWRPDNTGGEYPRLSVNPPNNDNGWASTFWIRDGKYIRLKSAQIGYTIPSNIITKAGISQARIFVEGSNLFTLSGLPEGIDPEMPQVTNAYYPQQRTYMGGISLTF